MSKESKVFKEIFKIGVYLELSTKFTGSVIV